MLWIVSPSVWKYLATCHITYVNARSTNALVSWLKDDYSFSYLANYLGPLSRACHGFNDEDIAVGRLAEAHASCMHAPWKERKLLGMFLFLKAGRVESERSGEDHSGKSELCVLWAHSVRDLTLVRRGMMGFFFSFPPSILSPHPLSSFLPSSFNFPGQFHFFYISAPSLVLFSLLPSTRAELAPGLWGLPDSLFACHMEAPL